MNPSRVWFSGLTPPNEGSIIVSANFAKAFRTQQNIWPIATTGTNHGPLAFVGVTYVFCVDALFGELCEEGVDCADA